ncbi:sarcosine oxidase subunit gamma [Actibacterium ureilyticum]|uniref:sarcosine oxidase subunit gamma n=1 Tax=Actibacterium ureilyticum TaxID=1590614 RepID=UPI000BAA9CB6|nr:sarcosine oxidase subunit gamma [Actibacterium ureilyticum]
MTDLIPTTAFGTTTARTATHGALSMAEDVTTALASVALRRGADVPVPLGLPLPGPGGWAGADGAMAVCMGPDQWLILGADGAGGDFAADIAAAAPDCSVTEQTDGWVILDIRSKDDADGAPMAELLTRLVNLDPATLAPGRATRSQTGHLGIIALRLAPDRLLLLGLRSAAESLWQHLDGTLRRLAVPR